MSKNRRQQVDPDAPNNPLPNVVDVDPPVPEVVKEVAEVETPDAQSLRIILGLDRKRLRATRAYVAELASGSPEWTPEMHAAKEQILSAVEALDLLLSAKLPA